MKNMDVARSFTPNAVNAKNRPVRSVVRRERPLKRFFVTRGFCCAFLPFVCERRHPHRVLFGHPSWGRSFALPSL